MRRSARGPDKIDPMMLLAVDKNDPMMLLVNRSRRLIGMAIGTPG